MTHHWGYVGAISSALLFGIGTTLNKLVLTEVHPTVTAGMIYTFAGIFLALVHFTSLRNSVISALKMTTKTESGLFRYDLVIFTFMVLSGSTIAPYLFLNGLAQTTAVNASLLQNTESLWTVVIAFLFLRERVSRKDWGGILLLLIGVVFLTTNGEFSQLNLSQNFSGNTLIVAACLFWGIDNNLSRILSKREDLILITTLKCLVGGVSLLLLCHVFKIETQIPLSVIPYLMTVGAFSIGLSILLFLFALREIGSMKTGVIFSTSSLFGAAFAFVILREDLTLAQLIAGSVMLLGVYILYKR